MKNNEAQGIQSSAIAASAASNDSTAQYPYEDCLCKKCEYIKYPNLYKCKQESFGNCDTCSEECHNYEECRPYDMEE